VLARVPSYIAAAHRTPPVFATECVRDAAISLGAIQTGTYLIESALTLDPGSMGLYGVCVTCHPFAAGLRHPGTLIRVGTSRMTYTANSAATQ